MCATIVVRRSALVREIRFLGPAPGRDPKKQPRRQGEAGGLSDGVDLPGSPPDTSHADVSGDGGGGGGDGGGGGGDSGHSPGDSGYSPGDSGGGGTSD
jgi:hypothetical protein